jgi:hypothetical protein
MTRKMKKKYLLLVFIFLISAACGQSTGRATPSQTIQQEMASVTKVPIGEDISSEIPSQQKTTATEMILDFYVAYTSIIAGSAPANTNNLLANSLTKSLIEKTRRMRTAIGADPIIRAQDFSQDMIGTLHVKHLEENWYMVSYVWGEKQTDIPVRVALIDGRYMIDYITPEWNGSLYGDSLLCDESVSPAIIVSNSKALLETFYKAYVMKYCSMPENLQGRLEALRSKHLTANALEQFEEAANEFRMDGLVEYDLLINYFDFDRLWIPSIAYTSIDENNYKVSYTKWQNSVVNIYIKITKKDDVYMIDKIETR